MIFFWFCLLFRYRKDISYPKLTWVFCSSNLLTLTLTLRTFKCLLVWGKQCSACMWLEQLWRVGWREVWTIWRYLLWMVDGISRNTPCWWLNMSLYWHLNFPYLHSDRLHFFPLWCIWFDKRVWVSFSSQRKCKSLEKLHMRCGIPE